MKVQALERTNVSVLRMITASLVSVVVSLGLILLFALCIKWFGWSDAVITPVNIGIKIVSVVVGVLMATKNANRALIVGMIVGSIYVVFSFLAFSMFLGEFDLSINNLWDLCLGAVSGAIVGGVSNVINK